MIRDNNWDPGSGGLKVMPVNGGLFGVILHSNLATLDFVCSLVSHPSSSPTTPLPPPPKNFTIYFNKPEKVMGGSKQSLKWNHTKRRRAFVPKDPRSKAWIHQGTGHPAPNWPRQGWQVCLPRRVQKPLYRVCPKNSGPPRGSFSPGSSSWRALALLPSC